VAFALNLKHGYDDKLASATDSQNLAFAVEHHAAATIQKTDLVLNRLFDEFSPGYGGKGVNTQRISNYLLTLRLKQPELKSLRIVKADRRAPLHPVIYPVASHYTFLPLLWVA
jgi:hypothetical protein